MLMDNKWNKWTNSDILGSLISEDGYCTKRDLEKNWDGEESIYGKKKLFTGKMNLEL